MQIRPELVEVLEKSMTLKPPDHDCELTVLMPCLNEIETVARCISKAHAFLDRTGTRGEVLVADNGSEDGSIEAARLCGARVIHVPTRGYGAALMAGIADARGRFVIMGDADDSYDFSRLDAFLERLRAGVDLVMGNRFRGGIAAGAMPILHRYLGNPVLSFIGRLFFGSACRDFHCGLRGFQRSRIQALGLQTNGMEFASEMVVKATLQKFLVEEVPTTLSKDGRSRPPHLRTWRDGWRHLRFLLLYSPRWLFFYPGLLLVGLGLLGTVATLPGPLTIGGVRFDIHSLLVASATFISGLQILLFSILARQFALNQRLLPPSPVVGWLLAKATLERVIGVGLLACLLGLSGIFYGVYLWSTVGFGALDYEITMRIVIPATTAVIAGLQVVFAAFFSSVLDLSLKAADHS